MSLEKREVTQEDLDNDPKLVEDGVKVGDEHEFEAAADDGSDEGADKGDGESKAGE